VNIRRTIIAQSQPLDTSLDEIAQIVPSHSTDGKIGANDTACRHLTIEVPPCQEAREGLIKVSSGR
jgi:hypothetical protein